MPGGITIAGAGQALDTLLNTIYSEFMLRRDVSGVCRKVSTHYALKRNTGSAKNVITYGRVRSYDLIDAVDMAQAQTLSDTNEPYTPGEAGVQVIIAGSTLRRAADPELLRRTGRIMHNAYDLKEDADGTAQFTSFTPILGTAGTVVTVGYPLAASGRLRIGNNRATPDVAPGPYHGVFHPMHTNIFTGRLIPLTDVPTGTTAYTGTAAGVTVGPGRSAMSDRLIEMGVEALGRLSNIKIWEDGNIAVDASDDASSAVFSQEGLIYVSEVEPMLDSEKNDVSMRGAVELDLWGAFVWGTHLPDNYGVEILGDATLPTS